MDGRSNECGVNRLQETQKITSQREAREETSLSWLKEQGPFPRKKPQRFLVEITRYDSLSAVFSYGSKTKLFWGSIFLRKNIYCINISR